LFKYLCVWLATLPHNTLMGRCNFVAVVFSLSLFIFYFKIPLKCQLRGQPPKSPPFQRSIPTLSLYIYIFIYIFGWNRQSRIYIYIYIYIYIFSISVCIDWPKFSARFALNLGLRENGPKPSKISTESSTQLHKNGAHFHLQDLPDFLIPTPPIFPFPRQAISRVSQNLLLYVLFGALEFASIFSLYIYIYIYIFFFFFLCYDISRWGCFKVSESPTSCSAQVQFSFFFFRSRNSYSMIGCWENLFWNVTNFRFF
jgi:hypothetical protein